LRKKPDARDDIEQKDVIGWVPDSLLPWFAEPESLFVNVPTRDQFPDSVKHQNNVGDSAQVVGRNPAEIGRWEIESSRLHP
jgi:hypothetical protein